MLFSSTTAPVRHAAFETLEDRRLLAFSPTPFEQYMVELVNRARLDPVAEAARYLNYKDSRNNVFNGDLNEGLPAGTISNASKQPLAINPNLTAAARSHGQWMVDTDTFGHAGSGGSSPGTRISGAGYTGAQTFGENIAVNWSSGTLDPKNTVFNQHRDLFTDMPISDRGHRTNLMNGAFNEVGVGLAGGPWVYPGYGTLNSLTSTHDFGNRGNVFLTGVAFNDTALRDQFYTPGEGLGGIKVTATAKNGASYSAFTWDSGGYSLALPAGTYTVTASGSMLGTDVTYGSVTVASSNVKRDFRTGQVSDTPGGEVKPDVPVTPVTAALDGRVLVVTGTAAADALNVTVNGSVALVYSGKAVLKQFATSDFDRVAITGGEGNDRISVVGVAASYLDGGYGRDTLVGGEGSDSLYGSAQPDHISGGAGNDVLVGGNGHDRIYGEAGVDRVYGNSGNDTVDAGPGNDRVYGGDDDDLIAGGAGRDVLYGESGIDILHGGRHSDYSDNDPADTRIAIEVLAS
ncbi:MAG TPA: CAP domain-containing protein [Tepidisphaeraceae bacterium]|jgi:Ca2+-binding RTX toxin-like protein